MQVTKGWEFEQYGERAYPLTPSVPFGKLLGMYEFSLLKIFSTALEGQLYAFCFALSDFLHDAAG